MTAPREVTAWPDAFESVVRRYVPLLSVDAALTSDLRLADHGLDSLGTVDLLVAIEDEFDIVFPDDQLAATAFETPEALWTVLRRLV
jgi:acyl carrier protein